MNLGRFTKNQLVWKFPVQYTPNHVDVPQVYQELVSMEAGSLPSHSNKFFIFVYQELVSMEVFCFNDNLLQPTLFTKNQLVWKKKLIYLLERPSETLVYQELVSMEVTTHSLGPLSSTNLSLPRTSQYGSPFLIPPQLLRMLSVYQELVSMEDI